MIMLTVVFSPFGFTTIVVANEGMEVLEPEANVNQVPQTNSFTSPWVQQPGHQTSSRLM